MQEKSLDVVNMEDIKSKVSDVKVFGDPGMWKLLCKASSEEQGWMKSTKVMDIPEGKLYQVSTQQRNPDGSWTLAEAITFVPRIMYISNECLTSTISFTYPPPLDISNDSEKEENKINIS